MKKPLLLPRQKQGFKKYAQVGFISTGDSISKAQYNRPALCIVTFIGKESLPVNNIIAPNIIIIVGELSTSTHKSNYKGGGTNGRCISSYAMGRARNS